MGDKLSYKIMNNCVFCKIISGEIPGYKVYEDDSTLAFLDIAPVSHGHTLVVTKKHYANMEEVPAEELSDLIKAVKKVGRALKDGLEIQGYNIQVNNGPAAGQIVPHLHFHVTPRIEGDGLQLWPQGKYKDGEAEEIIKKISLGL